MTVRKTRLDLRVLEGLPAAPDGQPEIHAQCVRVAQRPHAEGRFAVGLLPCDERVGVPALALHLGWAFARLARRGVGLVDANVRYPAFPVEARRRLAAGPTMPGREGPGRDDSVFVEQPIDEWLTLLSPRGVGEAGAGVPQLALIVEEYRAQFAHLVVDLTGFQRLGDHLNAMALLDGVIVVVRSRSSRETDLIRLKQEIPTALNLGAILLR